MHDDKVSVLLGHLRVLVSRDVSDTVVTDHMTVNLESWRKFDHGTPDDDLGFAEDCQRLARLLTNEMDRLSRAAGESLIGSDIIARRVAALEAAQDVALAMSQMLRN